MKLSAAQWDLLDRVCRSNGGGIRVRCRVGDDGYGVPTNPACRKLWEADLIQGKSGSFETVVHTTEGLALWRTREVAR